MGIVWSMKPGSSLRTCSVSYTHLDVYKRQLLKAGFGWRYIIDLGDITTARATEMYLPLWLRLWGSQGTGMLNIKVMV